MTRTRAHNKPACHDNLREVSLQCCSSDPGPYPGPWLLDPDFPAGALTCKQHFEEPGRPRLRAPAVAGSDVQVEGRQLWASRASQKCSQASHPVHRLLIACAAECRRALGRTATQGHGDAAATAHNDRELRASRPQHVTLLVPGIVPCFSCGDRVRSEPPSHPCSRKRRCWTRAEEPAGPAHLPRRNASSSRRRRVSLPAQAAAQRPCRAPARSPAWTAPLRRACDRRPDITTQCVKLCSIPTLTSLNSQRNPLLQPCLPTSAGSKFHEVVCHKGLSSVGIHLEHQGRTIARAASAPETRARMSCSTGWGRAANAAAALERLLAAFSLTPSTRGKLRVMMKAWHARRARQNEPCRVRTELCPGGRGQYRGGEEQLGKGESGAVEGSYDGSPRGSPARRALCAALRAAMRFHSSFNIVIRGSSHTIVGVRARDPQAPGCAKEAGSR